ncbi:MAG: urease accessory protein UreD [Gammaproteobacteria bacterium]|nr:urease accessory protein UreD [Gammaproteobacteria bacterium]
MNLSATSSKNWKASLTLDFIAAEHKTHLVPVQRYGPLSVQRAFYPEGPLCHTYLLHPPGGVVGGDELNLEVDVGPQAQTLLTTPGATKFYLSAGQSALVSQAFKLHSGSSLEFLPQENIYFPGAKVRSRTSLVVDQDSTALIWEKHSYGRPVIDEAFSTGEIITSIELSTREKLLFTDTQRIHGQEIQCSSGLRGLPVAGTFLIYSSLITASLVEQCRQLIGELGFVGITQPLKKLLVIRYMGQSIQDANQYFVSLWQLLRPAVLERKASYPRIWNT